MKEPARHYFVDSQGQTCWIQRLGSLDAETIYWIGGPGYEMRLFSAKHAGEAEFTRDELLKELEGHDQESLVWH